jgi:hypothetical protein
MNQESRRSAVSDPICPDIIIDFVAFALCPRLQHLEETMLIIMASQQLDESSMDRGSSYGGNVQVSYPWGAEAASLAIGICIVC